jgi:hypothetical protein
MLTFIHEGVRLKALEDGMEETADASTDVAGSFQALDFITEDSQDNGHVLAYLIGRSGARVGRLQYASKDDDKAAMLNEAWSATEETARAWVLDQRRAAFRSETPNMQVLPSAAQSSIESLIRGFRVALSDTCMGAVGSGGVVELMMARSAAQEQLESLHHLLDQVGSHSRQLFSILAGVQLQ